MLTTDSCDNSTNIVYSDNAYAVDFSTVIKGVIWDEGKPYTPQAYKRKMLNKSITDTNELRRRTITDDFLINIIYCGRGGLYGYIVTSMSTYLTYEIVSIDTIKAKGGRKIQKDKIYRLSIVPYFNRPENSYPWHHAEHMYIDGKYVVPAYYLGIGNIYLSPNIKGHFYYSNNRTRDH